MKKVLALFLSLCMVISICSCGSSKKKTTDPGTSGGSGSGTVTTTADAEPKFDENAIINNLTTQAVTWQEKYGGHHLALIVKNNSEYACELKADVVFKDAAGATIGAKNDAARVGANAEVCFVFDNADPFTTYEYNFTADESIYNISTASVTCEPSIAKDKVIVGMTNNSDSEIESIDGEVLFYNGDQVVGSYFIYITDVAAGKTSMKEAACYEAFDSVKVYYSAYTYES